VATTLTVSLAGSRDRQVEELLQTSGLRVMLLKIEELAALAQPAAQQPSLVVVDMRDRQSLPPTVAMLRRQHPGTGVVIVAAALEPALMLDAMRAGVTEFVTAPLAAAELQAAIRRVTTPATPAATGEVFAFVGAKGGVGTTTVAVNVATALAQQSGGATTLLIDLHLAYGDAAVFLGTEPRFSVLDALENVHRLDKAFLNSLVAHANGGLALLASSDRAATAQVDTASVRSLIDAAAHHYRYVVLDVPRADVMLAALETASRLVIVANQELATVRAATRLAAMLRQRYGKDRLSVVVSRFDQLADIAQEDVEKSLGSPVAHTFPSDYRVALQALNAGRPVVLDNHNRLSAALSGFARGLVAAAPDEADAPRQSGFFSRLTGRRAQRAS
jgi:pilus assembly protein CpaE